MSGGTVSSAFSLLPTAAYPASYTTIATITTPLRLFHGIFSSCHAPPQRLPVLRKSPCHSPKKPFPHAHMGFPACRKRLSCMLKGAFLRRKSRCQTVPDVKNRTADAFPACRDSVSDGLRYLFCEKTMSCFFTFIMHKYSSP